MGHPAMETPKLYGCFPKHLSEIILFQCEAVKSVGAKLCSQNTFNCLCVTKNIVSVSDDDDDDDDDDAPS